MIHKYNTQYHTHWSMANLYSRWKPFISRDSTDPNEVLIIR